MNAFVDIHCNNLPSREVVWQDGQDEYRLKNEQRKECERVMNHHASEVVGRRGSQELPCRAKLAPLPSGPVLRSQNLTVDKFIMFKRVRL